MKQHKIDLPYLDNWKAILITMLINLASVLIFQFSMEYVDRQEVILDSLICGALTAAIDVTVVYYDMKRRRSLGLLPTNVPVSANMQRLPKNPVLLALVYMPVSAIVISLINWGVMAIFGIESFGRWNWLIYKLIYSWLLGAKIVEYCIYRFIQPDWAGGGNEKCTSEIRIPLPVISILKEMYASLSANIAMNMIIGTIMGGLVVGEGQVVLVYPTSISGIRMTGLIFGLLTGLLLTRSVLGSVKHIIRGGTLPPELPPADRRFSWLPKNDIAVIALVCLSVMIISVVLLPLLMQILGVTLMNFYQFCIFITIYGMFIGKVFSKLIIARCLQSDFINWFIAQNSAAG